MRRAGGGDRQIRCGWFQAVELDAEHVGCVGGGGHLGDEAAGDEVIGVVLEEMGFDPVRGLSSRKLNPARSRNRAW